MKTNKEDIEIMLFDYAEGNLSSEERKEVEEFLKENPQYAKMLDSYQESPILEKPLEVKLENKNELLSLAKGKKTRKIVFKPSFIYWSSAIAAVVLLFFTIRLLVSNEENSMKTQEIALTKTEKPKKENKTAFQENISRKKFTERPNKKNISRKKITETPKKIEEELIEEIVLEEVIITAEESPMIVEVPIQEERILYMRYEESIVVKEVSKPSLASRIAKSIGLEEKIEEFYNSELVSNTREFINTGIKLGNKRVKTTTTEIRREEKINV